VNNSRAIAPRGFWAVPCHSGEARSLRQGLISPIKTRCDSDRPSAKLSPIAWGFGLIGGMDADQSVRSLCSRRSSPGCTRMSRRFRVIDDVPKHGTRLRKPVHTAIEPNRQAHPSSLAEPVGVSPNSDRLVERKDVKYICCGRNPSLTRRRPPKRDQLSSAPANRAQGSRP